ncbi:MAG: hypothetical protein ACLP74_01510 [Thermoplasmata archaeon]
MRTSIFDPIWVLAFEVAAFEIGVGGTILFFVRRLAKSAKVSAPIFTVLNDASPRQVKLIRRWAQRQIFDPQSGLIAVEERRIQKGLEPDVS